MENPTDTTVQTTACTSCGGVIAAEQAFCPSCGTPKAPQGAPGMPVVTSSGVLSSAPGDSIPIDVGRRYVSLGGRFMAALIDSLIIAIPNALLVPTGIGPIILYWLYFALQHSGKHQATIGKRVMGIVITDEHGGRISFGKATVQVLSSLISSFILLIGFIMIAFTEKRQGLHDMMAGTLHYYRVK